ncbi:MAG: S8 family serine peptidase [Chloroflexota bacterium]
MRATKIVRILMLLAVLILQDLAIQNLPGQNLYDSSATVYAASDATNTEPSNSSPTGIEQAGEGDEDAEYEIILLHFDPNISDAERDEMIGRTGGELVSWIAPIGVAKIRVRVNPDVGGVSSIQAVDPTQEVIQHVEEDGEIEGFFEPNDPDITDPQKVYVPNTLNLFSAWDYTTGSPDVVIAVLDTGVALEHPEFQGRLLTGYDYVNHDMEPDDDHGHGTHVAGIAAAGVDNGHGAAGLCGNCSVMPIKVLNENNSGVWSSVAEGLVYAADNGADIVVLSLGSPNGNRAVETALTYAAEKDVLVVAAAGNENSSKPFYPAAYTQTYENVISVSATDQYDQKWSLSNFGDTIDVSAPGNIIYNAFYDLDNFYGGYIFMSGTSMATPHVAGLAGLLLSQKPERTSTDLKQVIIDTAVDLGEPGWDQYFGNGRIDALAALQAGAQVNPLTASLNGLTWNDSNGNGIIDSSERFSVPGIQVDVFDASGELVESSVSDDVGAWSVEDLDGGVYSIKVNSPDALIVTTQSEFVVVLSSAQKMEGLNFGFAPKPTSTAIDSVNVIHNGTDVELSWEVTSQLVDSFTVERSTNSNDGYVEVGQKTVSGLSSADSAHHMIVDTLPNDMQHSVIYYRIQIHPGDAYYGPIMVEPAAGTDEQPDLSVDPVVEDPVAEDPAIEEPVTAEPVAEDPSHDVPETEPVTENESNTDTIDEPETDEPETDEPNIDPESSAGSGAEEPGSENDTPPDQDKLTQVDEPILHAIYLPTVIK